MLSRFRTIPTCHGRTDRRTDRQTDRIGISISRVNSRMLTRDKKNRTCFMCIYSIYIYIHCLRKNVYMYVALCQRWSTYAISVFSSRNIPSCSCQGINRKYQNILTPLRRFKAESQGSQCWVEVPLSPLPTTVASQELWLRGHDRADSYYPRRLCRSAWVEFSSLSVCPQHNSKTNDLKVLGMTNLV